MAAFRSPSATVETTTLPTAMPYEALAKEPGAFAGFDALSLAEQTMFRAGPAAGLGR